MIDKNYYVNSYRHYDKKNKKTVYGAEKPGMVLTKKNDYYEWSGIVESLIFNNVACFDNAEDAQWIGEIYLEINDDDEAKRKNLLLRKNNATLRQQRVLKALKRLVREKSDFIFSNDANLEKIKVALYNKNKKDWRFTDFLCSCDYCSHGETWPILYNEVQCLNYTGFEAWGYEPNVDEWIPI